MADAEPFDAPTKGDMKRAQQRPENRPVSYEEQDHAVDEGEYQRRRTSQKRHGAIIGGLNQAKSISGPDFGKPAAKLLGLIALNFAWSIWRTTINNPTHLLHKSLQAAAGLWVVALGILVIAEFNPQLAFWLMVLVTVGNIVTDNAANQKAIGALNLVFGNGKG